MGISDALGISKLAVDGVRGLTDVVESMHGTIAHVSPIFGGAPQTKTRGLTRLVYQAIRGVTSVIGHGVELARSIALTESEPASSPRREVMLSVLNGIVGDHLAASGNPLALPMRLHVSEDRERSGRLLVMAHGLCASHLHWTRNGLDHGAQLAASHGFTPVYASYNTGRHISTNGRELAAAIETLVEAWPVPVTQIVLLGHSMGGLVARSTCEYARRGEHRWLAKLTDLICLGTPHHGAPLERAGNLAALVLALSPYAAPIARVGGVRSAGISDLRFGNTLDEHWTDMDVQHRHDPRSPLPLPAGVRCFSIAATLGRKSGDLRGDGLVPVASALGQHADATFSLMFPAQNTHIVSECGHLDLLDSPLVQAQLATWLRT